MQHTTFGKKEMQPSVLIIEDEEAIITMIQYNLEKYGYKVRSANNSEAAMLIIEESRPDIIILDWMLPSMSGVDICRMLRRDQDTSNIPIIMLSARGEEADKIEGLDAGVDDYLVKPFSPAELMARIRAVFRRIRPAFSEKLLQYEDIKMDIEKHTVTRGVDDVHLGPTEFRILQSLMEHTTRVLSREQLIRRVWGYDVYVEPRTVDVHINRLRKALNFNGDRINYIHTIRSAGYCIKKD
jgi:two-component system phosphate regulon response regulator PhoB